jgi:AraC-like DNA-binding protein
VGKTEITIERGTELSSARRVHVGPAVVLGLGATVVDLVHPDARATLLDRSNVAFLAKGKPYRLKKKSATAEVLTIEIGERARADACREYAPHVDAEELDALFAEGALLSRTRWFDEIAHRYLFERDVCKKTESRAARFLEAEIAKELYFLTKEQKKELARRSVVGGEGELAARAIALIEEDLFRPLRVAELARACHASESTLLRAFKKEVGVAPATYQRDRRLDEALLLLRGNRFGVGEIATRVGYTNLAAFTSAFRRRFGAPPSTMLGEGKGKAPLPPHGMRPEPPKARRRNRRSD